LLHPLDRNNQQLEDIAPPCAASDAAQISSLANQISQSIPNTGAFVQRGEESTGVPPTMVSEPESSPVMMPLARSGVIPEQLPLFVESALVRPDHPSRPQGSPPSALIMSCSRITPQVTPVLDIHATRNIGTLSSREHDETRDSNPPIPMEDHSEVYLDAYESLRSSLDISDDTFTSRRPPT
jgi:hypothetical protein